MLEGLITFASYSFYDKGFSGGEFGSLLSQWENMGVFEYMLPFLLIFALVYGILSKVNLFGDSKNKTVNAIIALVVGLMALQFEFVPLFFSDIFPRLGVALAGVLVFLILMGLFANPDNKGLMNTLMWGSFGIAILIVLQSLDIFEDAYFGGDYFLKFIPYDWIPWIVLIVFVVVIVASAKEKSTDTINSIFSRGLKEKGQ